MNAQVKVRVKAKRCACCGEMNPADEFYADPRSRTGLQSYCKPCLKAVSLERHHRRRGSGHRAKWAAIAAEAAASA